MNPKNRALTLRNPAGIAWQSPKHGSKRAAAYVPPGAGAQACLALWHVPPGTARPSPSPQPWFQVGLHAWSTCCASLTITVSRDTLRRLRSCASRLAQHPTGTISTMLKSSFLNLRPAQQQATVTVRTRAGSP
jgi:hypothetical protein